MLMLSHIAEPRPRYLVTPSEQFKGARMAAPTTALACLFFRARRAPKGCIRILSVCALKRTRRGDIVFRQEWGFFPLQEAPRQSLLVA